MTGRRRTRRRRAGYGPRVGATGLGGGRRRATFCANLRHRRRSACVRETDMDQLGMGIRVRDDRGRGRGQSGKD